MYSVSNSDWGKPSDKRVKFPCCFPVAGNPWINPKLSIDFAQEEKKRLPLLSNQPK